MKKFVSVAVAAVALSASSALALDVKIYSGGYTENFGVGIDFSGATLAGTFTSPDIMFGTTTGFNWHPFGLSDFAADITGTINAVGGDYDISLFSDDGSYMYIDGVLQISRPGAHAPDGTTATITLTPGIHTVEVSFFECCSGPSGLDAVLPAGVTFNTPDAGSTLGMMSGALGLLGVASRRLRK
jgi:hypothetical protein